MNKKENKLFKRVCIIIFILFLCLYAISKSGYISKINFNKTLYTEDEIRKFEEKILNGEEIDIDDYFKSREMDYSNKFSIFGVKISNMIKYIFNKLFFYVNEVLSYFV